MVKTIFNNLENDVKSLIKYECGNPSDKTNDTITINTNVLRIPTIYY